MTFPAFVFLHESGHYLAGRALGFDVRMHFARTTFNASHGQMKYDVLVAAAGPVATAVLGVAGYLWLRSLRRHRLAEAPTLVDWLVTCLAMNLSRWLRALANPPSHPQPDDEAGVSRALGLPQWLLPYVLGVLSVIALVAIIRLHPPGSRLVPFCCLMLGGCLGVFLWFRLVGPFLLP